MNQNSVYGVEIHTEDSLLHYLAYKPLIIKEDQREYVEFYNGNRYMMPEIVKILHHNMNQIAFIDHRHYKIIMTQFTRQNWNQMKSIYFENDQDILTFIPTSDEELIDFLLKVADNA